MTCHRANQVATTYSQIGCAATAAHYEISRSRVYQLLAQAEIEKERDQTRKQNISTYSGAPVQTLPIHVLYSCLTVRLTNSLKNYMRNHPELQTIGDIMNMKDSELLKIPLLGRKTLKELKEVIQAMQKELK